MTVKTLAQATMSLAAHLQVQRESVEHISTDRDNDHLRWTFRVPDQRLARVHSDGRINIKQEKESL